MNVSFTYYHEDKEINKIVMDVTFGDIIDGLGQSAVVKVWVPASDSRSELETSAKAEARKVLERVISDHYA